jgi:4-aminobutyrate aminotransferase-like enzyme
MDILRIMKSPKELKEFKKWFCHKAGIDESQIPEDSNQMKEIRGCGCGMVITFSISEKDNLQEKIDNAFTPLVKAGVTGCLQCGEKMKAIQLMPPLSTWRCEKCKITVPGISMVRMAIS